MFYVPDLHYCDQLTPSKRIAPELLGQLPDYLFVGRSRPEVILVALPQMRHTMGELRVRQPDDVYELTKVLEPYWNYTSKAEIPSRFFAAPPPDGQRFVGMGVLVLKGSPMTAQRALRTDP